ncbi:MAG: hypothetical protein QG670_396 [Thermoproteota archaeon]|nr:hypothetical protein [Thermoproteota archaeon]
MMLLEQERRPIFQVVFLKDNDDESIWIEEVNEINFSKIRKHLDDGESVFITKKPENKLFTYCQTEHKPSKRNRVNNSEINKIAQEISL